MTTAEAAQKWAEAKDKLVATHAALTSAREAHQLARNEEETAWIALRDMSGRPAQAIERFVTPPPDGRNGEYSFDDGFKRCGDGL